MEKTVFLKHQKEIFDILRTNPGISITDLAKRVHRTRQTVYSELAKMRKLFNLELTAVATPEAQGKFLGVVYQFNLKFHRKPYLRDQMFEDLKKNQDIAFLAGTRGESDAFFVAFYESLSDFIEKEKTFREKYSEVVYNIKYSFFETSHIEAFRNYSASQTKISKTKSLRPLALAKEGGSSGEGV